MKVTLRSLLEIPNKAVLMRSFRTALMPAAKKVSLEKSLEAAYSWICAAQDSSPDGGVAGCYNLVRGWGESYPETTGYIIPTFLAYGRSTGRADAISRAIRMADWECDVQLPYGAVRSGMLDVKVGPAVFNTGQVLFGWVSAYEHTRDERYARAAANASSWLTQIQDPDGAWRKHLSVLTSSSVQTYNVRAAWGLGLTGHVLGEEKWVQAAMKNCDWALEQQLENGWFAKNTFTEREQPLLHTIGYVLEGLLGVGELFGREKYINAVVAGINPLIELYSRMQGLRGRYDQNWSSTVSWRCLTGEAQVALVLERLAKITGETSYATVGRALLEDIARVQDTESPHVESYGSISGSHPIWGGYGPFNYLNWAPKFYMDALMLELLNVDAEKHGNSGFKPAARPVAV